MNRFLLVLLAVVGSTALSFAQLNMSLLSQIDYNPELNDVWGWVAADGTEYALVGLYNGLSIVSLADPANAEEVVFIPGQGSTWRDIKTWGDFAYVTTDQNGTTEGLLVIDLSGLPNSINYENWTPNLPGMGTLETCHNIYIDEFGYAYLAGCNVNDGGMLYVDVFTTPGEPVFVAAGPNIYAHDVYVRDNRMYSSELDLGRFAIYDVSNKANSTLLATQDTPFSFTHNTWLSDDGNVLFTTDEKPNAPVASYDISDLTDIKELDQYKPLTTLGEGVIPHNVHVWNDWLIISYYTDGGIIVDAARPDNLIEVGNFDSFFGGNGGFDGAWGAYPFLPSGVVLITDISNGLYVLDANYVRACYLEGKVTDAFSGANLSNVEVEILSGDLNQSITGLNGRYQTGQVTPGTFDVRFSKPAYQDKIVPATLVNGQVTTIDLALEPIATVSGSVVRDANGDPIPGAQVLFDGGVNSFSVFAAADGSFFSPIVPGDFTAYVGAWGYEEIAVPVSIQGGESLTFTLGDGYVDGFALDQGWEVVTTASSGDWQRVDPLQSTYQGEISTPGDDVTGDIGDFCYVTGNGGNGGDNDVDNGFTTLTSPVMDLTTYNEPILTYQTFFFNAGGFGNPNDALEIRLSNGIEEVLLETIDQSASEWNAPTEFILSLWIDLTPNMRLIVETSDLPNSGNIVEAAFDAFRIIEGDPTAVQETQETAVEAMVYPNPGEGAFSFRYRLEAEHFARELQVLNSLGQIVETRALEQNSGTIELGHGYPPGAYFLQICEAEKVLVVVRAIKL